MTKTHLGHTARKRFGQNFLQDELVIDRILNVINPQDNEELVEIGPGLGALTEPMCERVTALTVIELDKDLAKRLRHHPFHHEKLTVIEDDAMKFDFVGLSLDKGSKLRIFGNLPYNISTPLMFHLFSQQDAIIDMHFMLQKEVVDRLSARPGNKHYGRLSIMAQYYCDIVPVIDVPPGAFIPPPKVNSAVVRLVPHESAPADVNHVKHLEQVCTAAFGQRRKTIRNSLKDLVDEATLTNLGIEPGLRAEKLTLDDFAAIANTLED